jgi:hypothetical protein
MNDAGKSGFDAGVDDVFQIEAGADTPASE